MTHFEKLSFVVEVTFKGWQKINLKGYDDINCLNKKLTHSVWYLEKEKGMTLQLSQLLKSVK